MDDLLRSKDMISGKRKIYGFIAAALLILLTVQPSLAEELEASDQASRPSLGGPDAVVNQMESDRADKDALYEFRLLKPYFDWKDGIKALPGGRIYGSCNGVKVFYRGPVCRRHADSIRGCGNNTRSSSFA